MVGKTMTAVGTEENMVGKTGTAVGIEEITLGKTMTAVGTAEITVGMAITPLPLVIPQGIMVITTAEGNGNSGWQGHNPGATATRRRNHDQWHHHRGLYPGPGHQRLWLAGT